MRRRVLLQLLMSGAGAAALSPTAVANPGTEVLPTSLRLALDRPIDGTAAPFLLAASRGIFRSAGLTVTTDIAKGSDEAIARLAAGASDVALADINALVRFRDPATAPPIKAVFVLFNRAGYAIIARKSRGVRTLGDLEGKTLGVVEGDPTIRLWPALAARNGLNAAAVKQQQIGAAVREPMLSAGQVDAVTGLSYLSGVNLKNRGIPADDLAVLRFADYGGNAYGAALLVNPEFAAAKPQAVRSLVGAVIKGVRQTIEEPDAAIDAVMAQMNGGARDLELERLRVALRDNIVTAEVRRDGLGGVDQSRFSRAIDDIAVDFKFRQKPAAADIFDASFLPSASDRQIR